MGWSQKTEEGPGLRGRWCEQYGDRLSSRDSEKISRRRAWSSREEGGREERVWVRQAKGERGRRKRGLRVRGGPKHRGSRSKGYAQGMVLAAPACLVTTAPSHTPEVRARLSTGMIPNQGAGGRPVVSLVLLPRLAPAMGDLLPLDGSHQGISAPPGGGGWSGGGRGTIYPNIRPTTMASPGRDCAPQI